MLLPGMAILDDRLAEDLCSILSCRYMFRGRLSSMLVEGIRHSTRDPYGGIQTCSISLDSGPEDESVHKLACGNLFCAGAWK